MNSGGTTKTFKASVNLSDLGGGNDDPMPWGAELTVSGEVITTQEAGALNANQQEFSHPIGGR